jgi:uncharacterized membrane protein YgcG
MTEQNAPESGEAGRRSKKRVLYGSLAAVAVLAVVAGSVYGYASSVSAARKTCEASVSQLSTLIKLSETAKNRDDVRSAAAVPTASVADAQVVSKLQKAMSSYRDRQGIPSCDTARVSELKRTDSAVSERIQALHSESSNLDLAVKAVVASRDAKSLAEAKGGLAQAVQDAQGTFDSSDGKVADTATRDRLREALDAANKVLADESVKDPKRYQDAQASLADPVNQVNESVNAKASADQAAAAAAAQAQAQAQAPAQSQPRQRSSSGSGSGSSTPRRSSGSTGSGSSNHGSTGSGTTPNTGRSNAGGGSSSGSGSGSGSSGSSSGGGSWRDQFNNNTQAPCAAGAACPIG